MTRNLNIFALVACVALINSASAKSTYEVVTTALAEAMQRQTARVIGNIAKTLLGDEAKTRLAQDVTGKEVPSTALALTDTPDATLTVEQEKEAAKIAAILATQKQLKELNAALAAAQSQADKLNEDADAALEQRKKPLPSTSA